MLISSAKRVARWSSCFLAFTIGCSPSAQSQEIWSISSGKVKAPSKSQVKNFSNQPGFLFRSVFVPPQYAEQAETPLPLSWWEQGSNSPVAIAIGVAEGTRQPDGSRTAAYYWHTDPGNAADNFGSFSFQHFLPHEKAPVQKQGSTDDKRWVSARRALPEVADRRQMQRLRRFHDQLIAQAKVHNLELSPLELLNGLDLANQSELAALDSWGYIDRLVQAKQMYRNPDEQILQARTWSYWHPTDNHWDAPGLGNTQASITRDQRRRAEAVKQVLTQAEQNTDLLAQLKNPNSRRQQRAQARAQRSSWSLNALRRQEPRDEESLGTGFVEQSLPLPLDAAQPLQELLRETQSAAVSPEQQADIALAEALAFDEVQADEIARSILAVEAEVELILDESTVSNAADSRASVAKASKSTSDNIASTVPALAPGWESGLLMASIQTEVPENVENSEGNADEGLRSTFIARQQAPEAAAVVESIEPEQNQETSPSNSEAVIANTADNSAVASSNPEVTLANAPSPSQEISVQLPPQPKVQAMSKGDAEAAIARRLSNGARLGNGTTLAIASPQNSEKSIKTASKLGKPPAVQADKPQSSDTEIASGETSVDAIAVEQATVEKTQAPSTVVAPAVTPTSVSVVAAAETSAQALANQTGQELAAAPPAPPPPPPLSPTTEALAQPATEAAMAAAEGVFVQHLELGQQRATEAAARAAAAREAAQKSGINPPAPPSESQEVSQTSAPPIPASSLLGEVLRPTTISTMMATPKLEADQVADAIIFFDGLTD